MPKPLKTFIIYAREDAVFKNELLRQLAPFAQNGLLEKWDDSHILPGEEWEKSIEKALEASHIVLMLVSADSLFSDFIQRKELKKHLNKSERALPASSPFWYVIALRYGRGHRRFADVATSPGESLLDTCGRPCHLGQPGFCMGGCIAPTS
ncbi:MAG: toll/interleukin-1 receptor domain-containing protein [Lewinellaceae bacterium]|nr:toll/interleukin-1 receptor domain-containing protein [Lewinellaceae bacterium]